MKLLLFEFKKFTKNTKNVIVIGSIFLVIAAICIIERQQLMVEKEQIFLEDSIIHNQLLNDLEELQMQEDISSLLMAKYVKAIGALENKVNYSNPEEWRRSLTEENTFIDTVRSLQKMEMLDYISEERLAGKAENEFYLEQNIKPDNSLYGVSGMYYVRIVLSVVFSIYGYLFFLLLFYDIFSRERENNNLNWLVTLPVSYKKITKSKTLLGLIVVVAVVGLGMLFTFILGAFLSQRVGQVNYPMEFRITNQVVESLSFVKYFFMTFIVFLLMVLLMLQLLALSLKIKISSEKILLFSIVSFVTSSQFARLVGQDLRYFTIVHYIDLSTTILRLYSSNLSYMYMVSIVILFLISIFIFMINNKNKLTD